MTRQQICESVAGSNEHALLAYLHRYSWLSGICSVQRISESSELGTDESGPPFFSDAIQLIITVEVSGPWVLYV
jgi:hypothetical protein